MADRRKKKYGEIKGGRYSEKGDTWRKKILRQQRKSKKSKIFGEGKYKMGREEEEWRRKRRKIFGEG